MAERQIPTTTTISFLAICIGLLGLVLPVATLLLPTQTPLSLIWIMDLGAHWQGLWVLCFVSGVIGLLHKTLYIILLLPLAAMPWMTAAPQIQVRDETAPALPSITVMAWNAGQARQVSPTLKNLIAEHRVDILVITELSPAMASAIAEWNLFPHRALHPASSPFGLGIASRHPLATEQLYLDGMNIPYLQVRTAWSERHIQIAAIHPMPPISPSAHRARDDVLKQITQQTDRTLPLLIAGDFNATPWSIAFRRLTDAGLRRATGLTPTWPALFGGVFAIPIDHVVSNSHWSRAHAQNADIPESDHRAVIARLHLRPE